MTPAASLHPLRHQLTLARCALGIGALGLSVPRVTEFLVIITHRFWIAVPGKLELVGAQGYIDLFHANLSNETKLSDVLTTASALGPHLVLFIGALLFLRGLRPTTLLVKKAMR